MREYEVTVILKNDLDDESRNALIERVAGWLTPEGDEAAAPEINHWGRRSLAYEIKGAREGYYVLYQAQLDPAALQTVEQDIQYQDDILRHLVVVQEESTEQA
ncbi:MAG: 30S ribosomal protein S6 [Candidatus Promineifilaceae bacterium]|nr:30S ribosomal protein S6 [Candidatus Promineifilaceae bacterium]